MIACEIVQQPGLNIIFRLTTGEDVYMMHVVVVGIREENKVSILRPHLVLGSF